MQRVLNMEAAAHASHLAAATLRFTLICTNINSLHTPNRNEGSQNCLRRVCNQCSRAAGADLGGQKPVVDSHKLRQQIKLRRSLVVLDVCSVETILGVFDHQLYHAASVGGVKHFMRLYLQRLRDRFDVGKHEDSVSCCQLSTSK